VLLIPRRVVPRLADLNQEEITDLFLSVQQVGNIIEKAYHAKALTISLQDGKSAGQSVAHVHVHILPRTGKEYGGVNDEVYPKLEENEGKLESDLKGGWEGLKDEDRKARSMEDMEKEAEWLSGLFGTE
jgi:bis(5'-adenosyl)-triphosphatase